MTQNNRSSSAPVAVPGLIETPKPQIVNIQLALNYLTSGLLGLLGSQKHEGEVRYHGYQALFTTLTFLAAHALLGILGGTFLLLQALADLAAAGFSLFQVFRAYKNDPISVPIISAIARKQAELASNTNQTLQ